MSEDPPETGWFQIEFEFKFTNAEFALDDMDLKTVLTGLGRAVAFLTLPEGLDGKVGVFVRSLLVKEVPFLSDWKIDQAISEFERELNDEDEGPQ
jgi:hypothetical protein